MSGTPYTTTETYQTTRVTVSFGPDCQCDIVMTIGGGVVDDDVAADGVYRPGCTFVLGGIDADAGSDEEIRVFRAFGEDELRAMAKAMLLVAGRMRRIESARRRNHQRAKEAS